MFGPNSVIGLDIETDNSAGFGLVPARSRVTEISIATADGGAVFNDDDELDLLLRAEEFLAAQPSGLIATWNGSFFDLPFLADRFATHPVNSGWQLTPDPQLVPKYEPLPGWTSGVSGVWHAQISRDHAVYHAHLDISQAYKPIAEELGVKWSLKPVCTALGIDMVELDRERLHDYTRAEREAYCLSDGHGARTLALRRLGW